LILQSIKQLWLCQGKLYMAEDLALVSCSLVCQGKLFIAEDHALVSCSLVLLFAASNNYEHHLLLQTALITASNSYICCLKKL
jgi:hypothetical protein